MKKIKLILITSLISSSLLSLSKYQFSLAQDIFDPEIEKEMQNRYYKQRKEEIKFLDVSKEYNITIGFISKKGVLKNSTDWNENLFKGNMNITRFELSAMLFNILKLIDSNIQKKASTFTDIPEKHWASLYVGSLSENKIVGGFPDGSFRGNRNLTRYEFAATLYNYIKILNEIYPSFKINNDNGTLNFSDLPEQHWVYNGIKSLVNNYNFFNNDYPDNTFRGTRNLTRYEAAKTFYKFLKMTKL